MESVLTIDNMAKELLRRKQGVLERAIVASGTLDLLASEMNSVHLLPDSKYDEIKPVKTLLNENDKAKVIVSALRRKVELKEDNFKKFEDILQNNKDEFEDIIDVLGI